MMDGDKQQLIPALAPFNPPLGPQPHNPKYYSSTGIVLALREKVFSLSGNDFTIKTADGTPFAKVEGKFLSVRRAKKFTDMEGQEIFTLTNELFKIQKSFLAESPNGHNFEITGKFKLGPGSRSVITFKNAADSRDVELEVKGKWLNRTGEVTLGDQVVATISRSFFNKSEFFGAETVSSGSSRSDEEGVA